MLRRPGAVLGMPEQGANGRAMAADGGTVDY